MGGLNMIEMIESALSWYKIRCKLSRSDAFKEYGKIAITALEKQLPKKPNYKSEYLMHFCPNCDYPLPLSFKFCNNCGQALKWGE